MEVQGSADIDIDSTLTEEAKVRCNITILDDSGTLGVAFNCEMTEQFIMDFIG